jgi:hypothetical protein
VLLKHHAPSLVVVHRLLSLVSPKKETKTNEKKFKEFSLKLTF